MLENAGQVTVTDVCPCGMMPISNPPGFDGVIKRTTINESATADAFVAVTVALCVDVSVVTDNPVGVANGPTAAIAATPYVVFLSCTVLILTNKH